MQDQDAVSPDASDERVVAGRYRLLAQLGAGGMGTVWRAKDETVDREVAVKEVARPTGFPTRTASAFERQRREARAAARLDHPAVVAVLRRRRRGRPAVDRDGAGRAAARSARSSQDGTLTPRRGARIGLEVLDALQAAHDGGHPAPGRQAGQRAARPATTGSCSPTSASPRSRATPR